MVMITTGTYYSAHHSVPKWRLKTYLFLNFTTSSIPVILRRRSHFIVFITSTKEVMFLLEFVCLCVRRITQKVMDGYF